MVQAMVAERFKVKLSHSSVGRLLHQLGLSAQRPLWRAYQQSPKAVKQWLETEYPAIRQRAQREGVQIFFADEAGVRSDFHSGTTWSPRGHTPVVSSTGARVGANMISAISAQGQLRFILTPGRVTAARVSQTIDGQRDCSHFCHCRRSSDASRQVRHPVCSRTEGSVGPVSLTSLLAGAEPGRNGMERSQGPWHRTQVARFTGAVTKDPHLPHAATAETAGLGAQFL